MNSLSTLPSPEVCKQRAIEPGPAPMRLLSPEQYLNTMNDLVGPVPSLASMFASGRSASALGFLQADVGQVELENYQKAADLVGNTVAANAATMNSLAPCATGADKRSCAKTFVQTFGAKAYRAPVTDAADIERHLVVFDAGVTTSYQQGIGLMLSAMLQSPRFLYHVEVGTTDKIAADAVKLTGFEAAARLSYAVWNTMPNDKLTAAATAGMLSTKEGLAAQLTWMLADPKGQTLVRRFLESWIHLSDVDGLVKDKTLFPQWGNATLKTSMVDQARAFFDDVLGAQGGKLASLLTSPKVFANKDLAPYYGTTSASTTFQPVQPQGSGTASGLLTLPVFLSTLAKPDESSPIYRGKFVREELLCQLLPPPPPNVPKAPVVQPGVSTRERLKQHEVDPSCSVCHVLMDPIGFGFENYDAIGQFRATDNGQAVDANGEVNAPADVAGKFNGVVELGQKLASSKIVQECMSRQWFRFMLSRFEQEVDGCSVSALVNTFRADDGSLNSLPLALIQTDAFLYRRPLDSKVSP
ncbi:MAG TPA: DUF1592 domain-containing protein [Polyangia bacterium]|jgi:hypothetical protein|nr:DUF1592 domain-containing protein [Polyangia bacterium]